MKDSFIEVLIKYGKVALFFILGVLIIKCILYFEKKLLKRTTLDESLHTFIINGSKILLYVLIVIATLGVLEVSPAPFVTVLGACGAAIALAVKDSLGNIAGGFIILINKPFKKGDTIEVAGVIGIVESIDLLVTILKTFDNKVVSIPNGSITTSVLVNYSKEDTRRIDCVFSIGYDADILLAKEIIKSVIDSNSLILNEPKSIIGVADHLDSGIAIDVKVWCLTGDFFDIKYYLEENVKLAFDQAKITIPYPHMDVHVIE